MVNQVHGGLEWVIGHYTCEEERTIVVIDAYIVLVVAGKIAEMWVL